jgi:Rrp15p
MPPLKRRKLSDDDESPEDVEDAVSDNDEMGSLSDASVAESIEHSGGEESDLDLDDLKRQKSKKTMKRKIRATGASTFGATLQTLLQTEAPSALPLSLKPSIARKHQDTKLELKAKKVLQLEKKEQEDKSRIKDVIGGWGGESERALRKVAQRGGMPPFPIVVQSPYTLIF